MNPLILRSSSLLIAGLLASCASTNTFVSADAAKQFSKIGVVSVAASSFSRQYVGVTMFGNELERKDVSSWSLNAEYEAQLASAIETVFGAKAVRAPYSAVDFSRLHELNGPWSAPAFWGPNWEAIENTTQAYCASAGVDAVVVAGRRKTSDIFGGTNQSVEGVGIYSRRGTNVLHALVVVGLLDCKTGKRLASRDLMRDLSVRKSVIPTKALSEDLARTKIPEWTSEIEQQLKQMAVALPEQAWVDTLRKIAQPPK